MPASRLIDIIEYDIIELLSMIEQEIHLGREVIDSLAELGSNSRMVNQTRSILLGSDDDRLIAAVVGAKAIDIDVVEALLNLMNVLG